MSEGHSHPPAQPMLPLDPSSGVRVLTQRSSLVMYVTTLLVIILWGTLNVQKSAAVLERVDELHEKFDTLEKQGPK